MPTGDLITQKEAAAILRPKKAIQRQKHQEIDSSNRTEPTINNTYIIS
tara:strand:- start:322 stop:465 length:144 start_codon:yes stop_codon:yes gene_type:complete